MLDDLYRNKNKPGWSYGRLFGDLDVIHDWNMRPSDFGLCKPDEDLNMMTAYSHTVGKMRAYENHIEEQKRKKL